MISPFKIVLLLLCTIIKTNNLIDHDERTKDESGMLHIQ